MGIDELKGTEHPIQENHNQLTYVSGDEVYEEMCWHMKEKLFEIMKTNFDIKTCQFHKEEISVTEADQIRYMIEGENEIKKHMIVPEAIDLLEHTKHFVSAKVADVLIGYTRLTPIGYDNVQEIGSSIVDADFRRNKVGNHMMQELLENSKADPVYGITNVKHVVHMFEELQLHLVSKKDIKEEVLGKIEDLGALLDDDVIYANKKFVELYVNQK